MGIDWEEILGTRFHLQEAYDALVADAMERDDEYYRPSLNSYDDWANWEPVEDCSDDCEECDDDCEDFGPCEDAWEDDPQNTCQAQAAERAAVAYSEDLDLSDDFEALFAADFGEAEPVQHKDPPPSEVNKHRPPPLFPDDEDDQMPF